LANFSVTPQQIKAAVQGDTSFAQQVITDSGVSTTINNLDGRVTSLNTSVNGISGKVNTIYNDYATGTTVSALESEISAKVSTTELNNRLSSYATKSDLDGISTYNYFAQTVSSYSSVDINGYLNTHIDVFVYKTTDGKDKYNVNSSEINRVYAKFPFTSTTKTFTHVSNNEYVLNCQHTQTHYSNRTKLKGEVKIYVIFI
jgi:hypothetical protein